MAKTYNIDYILPSVVAVCGIVKFVTVVRIFFSYINIMYWYIGTFGDNDVYKVKCVLCKRDT